MKGSNRNPWLSKKAILLYILAAIVIFSIAVGSKIVHFVEQGTYITKQSPFTGDVTAEMELGWMGQYWAEIEVWPKEQTLFYTEDLDTPEDVEADNSIAVRFNDSGQAKISSTLRLSLPIDPIQAADLVAKRSFKSFKDLERRLIQQHIRKCQVRSAFLMNSRESYRTLRPELELWTMDQIELGPYILEEISSEERDPNETDLDAASSSLVVRRIKKDPDTGEIVRETNPFEGTGIRVLNYEIKDVNYLPETAEKIGEQMVALMDLETLKTKTLQETQREKQAQAEGRAKAMKAKWEEEENKARQVVIAEMQKEMEILNAEKKYESAKLLELAAQHLRQQDILLGEGKAIAKRLIIEADGALEERLQALVAIQAAYAKAHSMRPVPSIYFAGGAADPNSFGDGSGVGNSLDFGQAITLLALNQIEPDLLGVRRDQLELPEQDIPEREIKTPEQLGITLHKRTTMGDEEDQEDQEDQ
jgi:regulator of protease activity HflC (stomatin/prohibitin superfamily)